MADLSNFVRPFVFDLLRPSYFVRDLLSFFRFLQTGMAEVREGLVVGV